MTWYRPSPARVAQRWRRSEEVAQGIAASRRVHVCGLRHSDTSSPLFGSADALDRVGLQEMFLFVCRWYCRAWQADFSKVFFFFVFGGMFCYFPPTCVFLNIPAYLRYFGVYLSLCVAVLCLWD